MHNEEGEIDEVTEYANECEALEIQRSLNVVQGTDQCWLRDNIFKIRYTCHGKVCNVIIDSGSCTNVVAEKMVKKLNLKTKSHPHLYKFNGSIKKLG